MNMNFKEWLLREMAVGDIITRTCVPMDQDDVDYLSQFPVHLWKTMLAKRYSEDLDAALDKDGNIRKGHEKMKPVVRKLKRLEYDVRNLDPGSGRLAGMKLMTPFNAHAILYGSNGKIGWIRWSAKQLNQGDISLKQTGGGRGVTRAKNTEAAMGRVLVVPEGFKLVPQPPQSTPEMSLWCPNRATARQSFGHAEGDPTRINITDTMKSDLKKDSEEAVLDYMDGLRANSFWNYRWMLGHEAEFEKEIYDYFLANTKRPEITDANWRRRTARDIMDSLSQRNWGGGSRRHFERTRAKGLPPEEIMLMRGRGRPRKEPELTTGPRSGEPISRTPRWQLQDFPQWRQNLAKTTTAAAQEPALEPKRRRKVAI